MIDVKWLDSMSVGIAEFDGDHRRVIALLREIAAAVGCPDDKTAIDLAGDLASLASEHVAREEAFLRRLGYPGTDIVISAQKENLGQISALAARLASNPLEGADIASNMALAFVNYLLRADINYKSFVQELGAADAE